jgi:hypothetical protein
MHLGQKSQGQHYLTPTTKCILILLGHGPCEKDETLQCLIAHSSMNKHVLDRDFWVFALFFTAAPGQVTKV